MSGRILTTDLPPLGGAVLPAIEDFAVEEVPAYAPSGAGEHVLLEIEKRDLSTLEVVRRLARLLRVPERDIGWAGRKDRRAVTRQWLSVRTKDLDRCLGAGDRGFRVLRGDRHGNKLRVGHLRGNRFRIVVRGAEGNAVARAEALLARLGGRGTPNGFGPQRFGARGDNAEIGALLLAGRHAEVVAAVTGRPVPGEGERVAEARAFCRAGDFAAALPLFPPGARAEQSLVRTMARTGDPARALSALAPRDVSIWVSAWQSRLFNACVAARGAGIGTLFEGDLAMKHENGAVFDVTDPAAEQPRADRLEVSPTGPMFGPRMKEPRLAPADLERRLLAAESLPASWAEVALRSGAPGERRALRVPVRDARATSEGEAVVLEFTLPSGSFATALLAEMGAGGRTAEEGIS